MSGFKVVDEGIPYGVYIWRINGKPLVNENYDYLQIASKRGDFTKAAKLKEFVNNELGIYEGEPHFMEGVRPISQAEYEDQMDRQLAGETPDPYDLGNLIEEYNYRKELDTQ